MNYYIMYVQCGIKRYNMSFNGLLRKGPIKNTNSVRNKKIEDLLYFTVRAQILNFLTRESMM